MSDELFEVAFSGKISAGANLDEVKVRVGKMFNAEGAKLAQLFSGQRLVIKKNVDQQTAQKYKDALLRVGAECDLKSMSAAVAAPLASAPPAPRTESRSPLAPAAELAPAPDTSTPVTARETSAAVAPPPKTDPLGITGDQIDDLAATLAPPGSELQSEIKAVPEPQYDLSAYEMAPVGDLLGSAKKDPLPPPPDTSGLSLAE